MSDLNQFYTQNIVAESGRTSNYVMDDEQPDYPLDLSLLSNFKS